MMFLQALQGLWSFGKFTALVVAFFFLCRLDTHLHEEPNSTPIRQTTISASADGRGAPSGERQQPAGSQSPP